MEKYSENYLLDKQIKIFQPQNGYRASTDAVLLAAAVQNLTAGAKVLDVGSGTGAISLCLAGRFAAESPEITGLELQPDLAELANQSAVANGFEKVHFINSDIAACSLPHCSFSHVISNPPYSENDMPSPNYSKATAHNFEAEGLQRWIDFCIKMLRHQGYFYMINRAAALEDILAALHGRLGGIEVIPLFSKAGQDAKRVIIRARKDSHAPLKIYSGIILHQEDGAYTLAAEQILRAGNALL